MKPPTNNIIPQGYKMTELGILPEEWEVVRLGEIFNVQQGKQLSEKESKEGKIKKSFLRTSNLNWGHIDISSIDEMYFTSEEFGKLKLESGDILVCEGGDVGRTALYRGELVECAYQNHLHRLRPKKDNLDVECFVFWMNYAINQMKMYIHSANRTTIPNLSGSRLKEFLIPLPPLAEQQKIAAVLSAVQEAKEKTEAVIKATKALKKSMMKHLFTYGPVSTEEAENVPLKETEIGPVPEDWEVVKLGEVAESFIGGGTPPTDIKEYWNGTVHWTTSKKINDLYLLNGEKKITEKGLKESSTHLIPKDNLIIGTRVGVGKVAINKIDIAISQDLTGVFIDNKKYSLEYLAYQISTVQIQKYLKECTRGTTIKGIPRDDLKRLPLQIPPLPIQQKIASILSAIDAKIEAEENKKKALEELFKSLLHNLMTAKIRVNHLEIIS